MPLLPRYVAGLFHWSAIGASSSGSQTHREMSSGLSTPVGFRNGTDGKVSALKARASAAASAETV